MDTGTTGLPNVRFDNVEDKNEAKGAHSGVETGLLARRASIVDFVTVFEIFHSYASQKRATYVSYGT